MELHPLTPEQVNVLRAVWREYDEAVAAAQRAEITIARITGVIAGQGAQAARLPDGTPIILPAPDAPEVEAIIEGADAE